MVFLQRDVKQYDSVCSLVAHLFMLLLAKEGRKEGEILTSPVRIDLLR